MTIGMVRTVRGDVPSAELGVTYIHEHLIIDSPEVASRWPDILLRDSDVAIDEVNHCVAAGVGAMVDAMPMASGRGPGRLSEISRATGVHIVMTTGLHTEKYYETLPWVDRASAADLASWFIADIEEGVDALDHLGEGLSRTNHRAGIIKVATSASRLSARAQRLFEAAAFAAEATGVPVLTHCEGGVGAMEQIEFMRKLGFPLGRVVVSHTDKVSDPGYHSALLESGVNLEFDQALRQGDSSLTGTAFLLAAQIERGFVAQLMLGTDGARRSLWSSYGGSPGLAWLAGDFRKILEDVGVGEQMQERLFVTNPERFLAMAPRAERGSRKTKHQFNEQDNEQKREPT